MYYYTVEDGKENCLIRANDKNEAIGVCNRCDKAQEVFEFNENDELVCCVYKK